VNTALASTGPPRGGGGAFAACFHRPTTAGVKVIDVTIDRIWLRLIPQLIADHRVVRSGSASPDLVIRARRIDLTKQHEVADDVVRA
jgi:hypothetical protein